MKHVNAMETTSLCPSAQPKMADSVVFGIIQGTVAEPRLSHLAEPRLVTDELLALASPVKPTEVFRFAAPCASNSCQHFDGVDCLLAKRIVELLPVAEEMLPPCRLRANCRWWQQEGKAACLRCPQIVTETYHPSELLNQAADPTNNMAE